MPRIGTVGAGDDTLSEPEPAEQLQNQQAPEERQPADIWKFEDLPLDDALLSMLKPLGLNCPTEMQFDCLSHLLSTETDILAIGGSGKKVVAPFL